MKTKTLIKKIDAVTIEIDGQRLSLDSEIVKTPGSDYYIHNNDGKYLLSTKRSAGQSSAIGGFHYGLIPEYFKAQHNIDKKHAKKIRGINAYSIWDNDHRPVCSTDGMVYIPKLKIWVDIYLCNSKYQIHGTSKAGFRILAGGNSNGRENPKGKVDFLYADFEEIAKNNHKRLITFDEFIVAGKGVKEFTSAEDQDDGTTKHIKDLVSKYGIEQPAGVQWIWSSEKIDNEKAAILGGARDIAAYSGSRASGWAYHVWYTRWAIGARFACDHLKPVKMSESEIDALKHEYQLLTSRCK